MGKMIKLLDIVGRLSDFDEDDTIYVAEPWTEDSNAMVATAPDDSTVPPKAAAKAGLTYFIEIFIAIEFTEAWVASRHDVTNGRRQRHKAPARIFRSTPPCPTPSSCPSMQRQSCRYSAPGLRFAPPVQFR